MSLGDGNGHTRDICFLNPGLCSVIPASRVAHLKELLLPRNSPNPSIEFKTPDTLFETKMTKIDTLYMTKTAGKPNPEVGVAHSYIADIRECAPPGECYCLNVSSSTVVIIQLFHLTLSDQSIKLEDKTARLSGIFI